MAMVAVGGSIGTGLLLGSGAAMEIAGPAAILSFVAAAFITWTVAMALGELASIIAFIVIGAALLTAGRVTPQYNAQGGFFPRGLWSPLVAMTYAVYSFGGVEMVAVTSGESRSSKETPRAVWLTFLTLTFV